jgi:hypothetical protein
MARLLVCLPLCLLLAPAYPGTTLEPRQGMTQLVGFAELPGKDPIAFLEKCLDNYDRIVKTGYTVVLRKQERIGGEMQPLERIEVWFKDEPHSVFFKWLEGQRKALRVLYVQGENQDRMLALPTIRIVGVVTRELDSPDAKASGRYSIAEFGLKKAMQRVVYHWKKAREAKALHVEYEGVHRVPELGDRTCYKLHRTRFARPEDDGVTDLTLYIDTETLLQVGSILKGPDGELVAQYFFRDIRLNPTFNPNQFTREALTAK